MNRYAKIAIPLLSLGLALIGCSHGEEPVVDATQIAVAAPTSTITEPTPATQPSGSPELAEPQKTGTTAAEFAPPFPQRLELFEPPQRALNAARRDGEDGETVELKGFIEVDEPRVVLSIDGVISSVPQGGEKYGVQVISIEPPTAVLQRGGRRWPATLE